MPELSWHIEHRSAWKPARDRDQSFFVASRPSEEISPSPFGELGSTLNFKASKLECELPLIGSVFGQLECTGSFEDFWRLLVEQLRHFQLARNTCCR